MGVPSLSFNGRKLVTTDIAPPDPTFSVSPETFSIRPEENGFLSWETSIWRCSAEHSHWVAATDEAPHTVPARGKWHDSACKFSTSPPSGEAKNLNQNRDSLRPFSQTPEAHSPYPCTALRSGSEAAADGDHDTTTR